MNDSQIEIRIVADDKPLLARWAAIRQVFAKQKLAIRLTLDRSGIDKQLAALTTKPQKIKFIADTSALKTAYDAFAKQAGKPIAAKITVDRKQLDSFQQTIGRRAVVRVATNTTSASAEMRRFRAAIASTSATLQIRAAAGASRSEIRTIRAELSQLKAQATTISLDGNTQGFTSGLRTLSTRLDEINAKASRLRATAGRIDVPSGGRVNSGRGFFGPVGGGAIGGRLGGIAARLAPAAVGAGAVAAFGKVATDGLKAIDTVNQYNRVLKVVIKDQEQANKLISDLSALNVELPSVDMALLAESATKLAGAEFNPSELPDNLRTIVDAAATSTVGIGEGTQRIVTALSQIKANGALYGEELNQLSELGLPIRQIISRQFGGQNAKDIAEQTQNGSLSVDTVIAAILTGLKEERGGSLKANSDGLTSQLASLGKKYTELSKQIATPIFEPLIEALKSLNAALDAGLLRDFVEALKAVAGAVKPAITTLGIAAERLGANKKTIDAEVTIDKGIATGELTEEQTKKAQAAQLGLNALSRRRKDEGQDAILSQQETATFFQTARGEFVDPSKITDDQRAAVTRQLDGIAQKEADTTFKGLNIGGRTAEFADSLTPLVDSLGVGKEFAAPEDKTRTTIAERFRNAVGSAERSGEPVDVAALAEQAVSKEREFAANTGGSVDEKGVSGFLEQVNRFQGLRGTSDDTGSLADLFNKTPEIAARNDNAGRGVASLAGDAAAAAKKTGGSFLDFAGALPGMAASGLQNATGIDVAALPGKAVEVATELRTGDALRTKDQLREESDNRRFDKAAADLPNAFKKFTADIQDPELRGLAEKATLKVSQVANDSGGFDPTVAIESLGELTRKNVQNTDFSGLNALTQSNVDEAANRELAKKQVDLQEKLNTMIEKTNTSLSSIDRKTAGTKETTIAAG